LDKWFTKSLIGPISHDFAMGGVVTKEQEISHAQYLDLIYSQIETLYNLVPDTPRPSTNPTPTPLTTSHDVDGVIDIFHAQTQSAHAGHTNPKYNNSNVQNTPTPSTGKTSEVNSVQSTPTGNNQNKKKGKGKNKEDNSNNPKYDKSKT
jgi:hypothetical protein